ncbi:hypothetical protein [uncultured Streptomyces sp.]|uniref:hypothetical protein n=1 Tax=uncultured Streptomyces sp. TaxID=174707 RepID=UPI0026392194|nr:hypothetical protein [uncultured Streptomyces sp.]
MPTLLITREDFPTSPLALRTADPGRQAQVRAFADRQAEAATTARDRLASLWAAATTRTDRITALRTVHTELVNWRYILAVEAGGRLGQSIAYDPSRFRMPIRPGNTNYDRLGRVGRLRDGAQWEPVSRTYTGGLPTPAYEAMLRYGRLAQQRFEDEAVEGDILTTWLTLPNGRHSPGIRIIRGRTAQGIARELTARVAARGIDASRMETGGNPVYTATPDPRDSAAVHTAALGLLADPGLTPESYLTARYLLFQSPQTKKGSDAVTRTFTVAVGALALGNETPALPADIDLRCYVLSQSEALTSAA